MKANYLLKKEAKAILSGNHLAFAILSFMPFLYNGGNFSSWWFNKLYNRQTFFSSNK